MDRSDNEERALDAIAPKMTSLHSLYIKGDMASALTIERYHPPAGYTAKYEVDSSIAIDLVAMFQVLGRPTSLLFLRPSGSPISGGRGVESCRGARHPTRDF